MVWAPSGQRRWFADISQGRIWASPVVGDLVPEAWLALAEGLTAGAMLTMIASTMIPEAANSGNPPAIGLGTLAGFLSAILFKLLE